MNWSGTSAGTPQPLLAERSRRSKRLKNRKSPAREVARPKGNNENLSRRSGLIVRFTNLRRKSFRIYLPSETTEAPRRIPRDRKRHGTVTSCTLTQTIQACRSAIVTSASLHDSQVAIPLIKMTSSKVTYLYDLMDAADDAKRIEQTSRELGHVPITDRNGRGREVIPMAPHEAERYKIRSGAERANSRLKEDSGPTTLWSRDTARSLCT